MESCFFISSLYEYNLIDKERTFHQKKEKKSKNKYYLKNVNSSFVQIMIFEFLPKKKVFEISFGSKYLYHNLKLKNMYKKYYQSLRRLKEYESPSCDIFSYYTNEELSNENIYYFDILSEIIKIMKKNSENIYEIPYNHFILEKIDKEDKIKNYKKFINIQNLLDEENQKQVLINNKNIELRCKSNNDFKLFSKNQLIWNNLIMNLNLQFDFTKYDVFDNFVFNSFPNLKSLILKNEGRIQKICFDENFFRDLQNFQIFNIYIDISINKGVEFVNIIELIMENCNISFDSPIKISKKIKILILHNCGKKVNTIFLNLINCNALKILNIDTHLSISDISSLLISGSMNIKNECIKKFIEKLESKFTYNKEIQFFFDYKKNR